MVDRRLVILVILVAAFAFLNAGSLLSVFFYGGTTQAMEIDRDGTQGGAFKEFAFADGYISAGSFGATYWTLKPQSEEGYSPTGARDATVFFYTGENTCKFTLVENTNSLDPFVIWVNTLNVIQGKDYNLYKPERPVREQRVDVMVFGPSDTEQNLANTAKNLAPQLNSGFEPTIRVAKQVLSGLTSGPNSHTFDAYRDLEATVGPNGIYRIKFHGTTAGATDCFSLLNSDTYILYSAKEGKYYPISKDKFSAVASSSPYSTITSPPNLVSDDLEGMEYSISAGMLNVVNPRPGEILITILVPTELYYNALSGDVSEEPTPGSTPVTPEFGGYGEPAACDLAIRDIAFSGDNSNRYEEGREVTTYITVENLGGVECLATVSASADYATAQTKDTSLTAYQKKQVPISVKFGAVAGEDVRDTITYKACSSSTVSGVKCTERDVSYSLYDKDVPILTPLPEETPAPEPERTCQERAQTRECGWNDMTCSVSKSVSEITCYEYFLPAFCGSGGALLVLVAVVGYLALKRRR